MRVAIAQIAPVFLDRARTLRKVVAAIRDAAAQRAALVAFGETLVPAYPIWLSRTDATRWNDAEQKSLYAAYVDQAVRIGRGGNDLADVQQAAREARIAVVLGVAERAVERGGHSLFASRVFIGGDGPGAGELLSIHRKLVPTYDERLTWAHGDGAGLRTHRVGDFCVGALNCWENWMPLARAALYAQGETLHVALWPGSAGLTRDITRFLALEGRSYVLSAGALIRAADEPAAVPHRARFVQSEAEVFQDGGSCVAGPDGEWIVPPVVNREELIVVDLDPARIAGERQNFDVAGHYARPDVLRLRVNRRRQAGVTFVDADQDRPGDAGARS